MREKKGNIKTAYEMSYKAPEQVVKHYADWAEDYDADTAGYGYVGPSAAAQLLSDHLKNRDATILDIGCGTGLVGVELERLGFAQIDGTDISSEMVEVCRAKGCYANLRCDDLIAGIDLPSESHDAVISVGTFGPLGPDLLPNALGQVRCGGIACISVNEIFLVQHDFMAAFDSLCAGGDWTQLDQGKRPHLIETGHDALITVLRRNL